MTEEIIEALRQYMGTNNIPALPGCAETFPNPSPQWHTAEGVVYTDAQACLEAPLVGIGTSTPTATLDVVGNASVLSVANPDASLTVGNSSNDVGLEVLMSEAFGDTDNTGIRVSASDTGAGTTALELSVDSEEAVLIQANSESDDKVFIVEGDGSVWATSIYVRLAEDFPDYVFEDDYVLMTLDELKEFIDKNGHLPNMPSSTEVAEKGADLGEISRVLVEKVEELTLHILELQNQIDELKEAQTPSNATQK